MPIQTRNKEPSLNLPPAELFLNDISEIVEIFQKAEASRSQRFKVLEGNAELELTFSVGDQDCDQIEDLAKFPTNPGSFELKVSRAAGYHISLHIDERSTYWHPVAGLTLEESWRVFHQLEPIFERRQLRWRAWVQRNYRLAESLTLLSFSTCALTLGVCVTHYRNWKYELTFVASALLGALLLLGSRRHSIVTLRNSWEEEKLREHSRTEQRRMFLASGLSLVVGLILGWVVHRYWH